MKTGKPLKIFLVDDEPFCLHLYEQFFMNAGCVDIHSFGKSADCLNQLTLDPDLIFLDYNMDNLNGIDILRKIKRFNPEIMVFFVSGQEEIGIAVNALKYGAFDYISKKDMSGEKVKACLEKVENLRDMLRRRRKKGVIGQLLTVIASFR